MNNCSACARGGSTISIEMDIHINQLVDPVDNALIEQVHQLVLATAPMVIISADLAGKIITANPAVEQMFGYKANELIGHNLLSLIPELALFDGCPSNRPSNRLPIATSQSQILARYYNAVAVNAVAANAVAANAVATDRDKGVIHSDKKNGEPLWISLSVNRVSVASDHYYIFVATDITEIKLKQQQISELNENLERRVNERTKELSEAHATVTLLLDSSAQGFLTIDRQLIIGPEYSKVCKEIFGRQVVGLCLSQLLFANDVRQQGYLQLNIERVMAEPDEFVRDLYLSLLTDVYHIRQRTVEIQFKYTVDQHVVLILTDVSARTALESTLNYERDRLKFIVATVQYPREFFELLEEFEWFIKEQFDTLMHSNKSDSDKLKETFRQIHTYKGLFAQLDFIAMPNCLHQLEHQLRVLQESEQFNSDQVLTLVNRSHSQEHLQKDIDIIETVLGKGFFTHDKEVTINHLQVQKIQQFIGDAGCEDNPQLARVSELLKDLIKARLVTIQSLLQAYPKRTERLASVFDKAIEPFAIKGQVLLVDGLLLTPFTQSLVHVFRNAIDHGIESQEQREAVGKTLAGNIRCHVEVVPDHLRVAISDDGGGLDVNKIKTAAINRKLYTARELMHMAEKDIRLLIFDDRLSTKTQITKVSGRGVGLSAVKAEVDKLGGSIEIASVVGLGTRFEFLIPYNEAHI